MADRTDIRAWGHARPLNVDDLMADALRVKPRTALDIPRPVVDPAKVSAAVQRMAEAIAGMNAAVGRAAASLALFGLQVYVSRSLPTPPPSDAEDARRIVRHGMADVLEWLGEDVGPKPGEVTHGVVTEGMLVCSPAFEYALRREYDPAYGRIALPGDEPVLRLVSEARRRSQLEYGAAANIDLPAGAL